MSLSEMSNDGILKELGHRARRARLAREVDQATLAKEAGIGISTLVRFEQGEGGNLETLLQILRVLGLADRLDTLFDEGRIDPLEKAKAKKPRQRIRTLKWNIDRVKNKPAPVFKNAPRFEPS